MKKILFNYSKLKGRIVEKCGTQRVFAALMSISEATLISKLKGYTYFTQKEIAVAIKLLEIQPGEVTDYFFTERV